MTSKPNPSTTSLESTTTMNSTSPLNSNLLQPPKDFAAALGALQSRYGAGGNLIPSPKQGPSKKLPDSANTSPAASRTPSVNTQSNSAFDSQVTLSSSAVGSTSSESEASSSSSGATATQDRKKSKSKTGSILKSIFKGKAKET